MPPQQVTTGLASMEGIERTNAVVRRQEQEMEAPRRDPYIMEVDQGRNCYACRGFGYMTHHCRNWERERVAESRRLEYGGGRIKGNYKQSSNLKEMENLESLN